MAFHGTHWKKAALIRVSNFGEEAVSLDLVLHLCTQVKSLTFTDQVECDKVQHLHFDLNHLLFSFIICSSALHLLNVLFLIAVARNTRSQKGADRYRVLISVQPHEWNLANADDQHCRLG